MRQKDNSSIYIYEELKKEIMFLDLIPGQNINEVETADRFNVSRTPIREAFKRLEIEGLIEIKRKHGTFVTLIDIDEIEDLMFMRVVLETAVLKEIGAISKSQEIKLEILISKQRELLDSGLDNLIISQKFLKLDNSLHAAFFKTANKEKVWNRISSDRPHYNRLRVLTNLYGKEDLETLFTEHVNIVNSIIKNDQKELESLYNKHIYRGMNNLTEIVKNYGEYFR